MGFDLESQREGELSTTLALLLRKHTPTDELDDEIGSSLYQADLHGIGMAKIFTM